MSDTREDGNCQLANVVTKLTLTMSQLAGAGLSTGDTTPDVVKFALK